MTPLSVVCWRWGTLFGVEYVNRLRAALDRHLHLDHELVCVTDDPAGLDGDIRVVAMPERHAETPRCRRRMHNFSRDFAQQLGTRLLAMDLDVVLVGDITPLVARSEPLVLWRVDYARVYSGAFILMDPGILHSLWQRFDQDPVGFPKAVHPRGIPSDQAMLNACLIGRTVPHWTERDGFVTYFGPGYERHERRGISRRQPNLPPGARLVVFGSDDKALMDTGAFPWIVEHWLSLPSGVPA